MRASIFAYTKAGCALALSVAQQLPAACRLYAAERLAEPPFAPESQAALEKAFAEDDLLIFVGACGIAVRKIAPYIKSKTTDPAVLCIDETGRFVIPLLSGHIGGANDYARQLAERLGATAVVTTATDRNGRFSCDAWAAKQGYVIDGMNEAKAVSAAILEEDIPLACRLPVISPLPGGLVRKDEGPVGIYIGYRDCRPFETTLRLVPRALHLGIGCRKGTGKEAIEEAVREAFQEHGLLLCAVKWAASIDLKKEEEGLLSFCKEQGLPLQFYSAEQLLQVPGDFTPSEFVQKITGVDNVCERAALLGAEQLIVKKTAKNGVTVAVAAERTEVSFE
ncbi:MAG: cobalt-precorrin 5A hydrolase [Firmicutes bacterium]|nr:cobalt-precorrin 5A hydrolase [Bacillota bacterium]